MLEHVCNVITSLCTDFVRTGSATATSTRHVRLTLRYIIHRRCIIAKLRAHNRQLGPVAQPTGEQWARHRNEIKIRPIVIRNATRVRLLII